MSEKPKHPVNTSKGDGLQPIEVAAGLIFRDGLLLIAQRPLDSHLGGLWEFPGGKREAGESYHSALERELQEELGVRVSVGKLIESIDHAYRDKHVRIRFFKCILIEGEPRPIGCHALMWVQRLELSRYEFPCADTHLLARLNTEEDLWVS